MSSYDIQRLETLTFSSQKDRFQDSCFLEQIEHILRSISIGVSTTEEQRIKLHYILSVLRNNTQRKIQNALERVERKMQDDRRAKAADFYSAYGKDASHLNSIDFDYEVQVISINKGTTLYQWCNHIIVGNEAVLYHKKTDKTTIGEYFSSSQSNKLGISPVSEIRNSGNHVVGSGERHLYRFVFPFSTRALVSIAANTIDNWSAKHYFDGTPIGTDYSGVWTKGGCKQYFIPLDNTMKLALAEQAQFVK